MQLRKKNYKKKGEREIEICHHLLQRQATFWMKLQSWIAWEVLFKFQQNEHPLAKFTKTKTWNTKLRKKNQREREIYLERIDMDFEKAHCHYFVGQRSAGSKMPIFFVSKLNERGGKFTIISQRKLAFLICAFGSGILRRFKMRSLLILLHAPLRTEYGFLLGLFHKSKSFIR